MRKCHAINCSSAMQLAAQVGCNWGLKWNATPQLSRASRSLTFMVGFLLGGISISSDQRCDGMCRTHQPQPDPSPDGVLLPFLAQSRRQPYCGNYGSSSWLGAT